MNFKQMMIEKLKVNVAYKVASNSTLIGEIADRVIDDLDYSDIAEELNIRSSDIADEIDSADIISEVTDHLEQRFYCYLRQYLRQRKTVTHGRHRKRLFLLS